MSRNPKRPGAAIATSCQCGRSGRTPGSRSKQCRVLPKLQPFSRQSPCCRRLLLELECTISGTSSTTSERSAGDAAWFENPWLNLRQIFDCYTLMKLRPCPSRNSSLAFLPAASFATHRECVDSCVLSLNGRLPVKEAV